MATQDLNTGRTPASPAAPKPSHASSLSIHMAKQATPTLGSALTPAQYRTRKVALITGKLAVTLSSAPAGAIWSRACVEVLASLRAQAPIEGGKDELEADPGFYCTQVSLVRMDRTSLSSSSRKDTRCTDCERPPAVQATPELALTRLLRSRIRRSSSFNTGRIEHLYKDVHERA